MERFETWITRVGFRPKKIVLLAWRHTASRAGTDVENAEVLREAATLLPNDVAVLPQRLEMFMRTHDHDGARRAIGALVAA